MVQEKRNTAHGSGHLMRTWGCFGLVAWTGLAKMESEKENVY